MLYKLIIYKCKFTVVNKLWNKILRFKQYHINSKSITLKQFQSFLIQITFFSALFFFPEIAFADPISEGVDWVMQLLTNGIARSAAIIGIAILGYLAWFGRITGETCGKYIAGIVLVFGGSTIVDLIISAVK
ncbi:type IV secretion protein [Parashewanella curva]|uniref:Type IV secretion protein n=1 Tax=Parashewanella curva TaxID=2338552 RepID=A0A3L8PTP1_9GAMM|nr:TrbC/VirB2 family protein [Parashewanella curva]RLV57778.1 type IV secretion protein [Parashewanella curva]